MSRAKKRNSYPMLAVGLPAAMLPSSKDAFLEKDFHEQWRFLTGA
jgi:hypothetical protein